MFVSWDQLMCEKEDVMQIPTKPRMERQQTLVQEHKAALHRAVSLAVPHAYSPSLYGTFDDLEHKKAKSEGGSPRERSPTASPIGSKRSWHETVAHFFDKTESGDLIPKNVHPSNDPIY